MTACPPRDPLGTRSTRSFRSTAPDYSAADSPARYGYVSSFTRDVSGRDTSEVRNKPPAVRRGKLTWEIETEIAMAPPKGRAKCVEPQAVLGERISLVPVQNSKVSGVSGLEWQETGWWHSAGRLSPLSPLPLHIFLPFPLLPMACLSSPLTPPPYSLSSPSFPGALPFSHQFLPSPQSYPLFLPLALPSPHLLPRPPSSPAGYPPHTSCSR